MSHDDLLCSGQVLTRWCAVALGIAKGDADHNGTLSKDSLDTAGNGLIAPQLGDAESVSCPLTHFITNPGLTIDDLGMSANCGDRTGAARIKNQPITTIVVVNMLYCIFRRHPWPDDPNRGVRMARRKARIRQAEIVRLFADRLREIRHSRGMTQLDLARKAHVTVSYIGRLESAGSAPGIDLVSRLADALGTTVADLLPTQPAADTPAILREQAERLFATLMQAANREMLLMLNPLLARLNESQARNR